MVGYGMVMVLLWIIKKIKRKSLRMGFRVLENGSKELEGVSTSEYKRYR